MVTHKTKEMLWKQILENPRDEELRLIYADVLEELGRTGAAKLIRENDEVAFTAGPNSMFYGYWRGSVSVINATIFGQHFHSRDLRHIHRVSLMEGLATRLSQWKKIFPIGWFHWRNFQYDLLTRYWWGGRILCLEKQYGMKDYDSEWSDDFLAKRIFEVNFPTIEFTIE